ncbi:hypothetical protein PMIN04_000779 [Paraphaeosphaeria minitans]
MKICLINSSYEGVDSPFEKYDEFPDPSRYIPKSRHEFTTRWVTKANAKEEIDAICKEDFDMFMNYMWGIETDDVAGVEATRYLETKGVPILTNPSSFLSMTKLDLGKTAGETGLRFPKNTPGRYPKIVKYSNGYGSLNLDCRSICHSDNEVQERIYIMEKGSDVFGILVQDYIIGKECSVIVLEMGFEVVALTPLQCIFPEDTPAEKEFLTWENKFEAVDKGIIKYAFVENEHTAALQQCAVDAFKAIGVTGSGSWARVDLRLEEATGHVYAIEVNCIPVVFYPHGNTLGDDLVVSEKFPGAQPACFDMMLATKQMQLGWHNARVLVVAKVYNDFALTYDAHLGRSLWHGGFGRLLFEKTGCNPDVSGIDVSEAMLEQPDIQAFYKKPLRVGMMQELIMSAGNFDHIVVFGAMHFLDTAEFNAVLARMFMLARKSVTFEIDDLDSKYLETLEVKFSGLLNMNNVQAVRDFGVLKGWALVLDKKMFLYSSPSVCGDVYGYGMSFQSTRYGHYTVIVLSDDQTL